MVLCVNVQLKQLTMRNLLLCLVLFTWCTWMAGGLQCLQCVDPKSGGQCRDDYQALVNASLGRNHDYLVKTCINDKENNFTQPYCVIEEYYTGGDLKSFIRDCSDGETFSFTGGQLEYPRLKQIRPDNFTTCVYDRGSHICITLCEGDFCNAPRPNLTQENECFGNTTDNETCAARSLHVISGPFGPIVDSVLGRGYFMPLVVSLVSVLILA